MRKQNDMVRERRSVRIAALGLAVATLGGCAAGDRSRDRPPPPDWFVTDAGVPRDAGATAPDGGVAPRRDSGASSPADAGAPDGFVIPTTSCIDWPAPAPEVLPRCEASTHACLMDCSPVDLDCALGCLAADAHPATTLDGLPFGCRECVSKTQFSCLDARGCHAQLATLSCCAEDKCGGLEMTCMSSECASELSWLQECADRVIACGIFGGEVFDSCFEAE